jgi:hypothetical protein
LAAAEATERRQNIHIDGCEGAVGDGAADGTSERKSRVQSKTSGSGWVGVGSELSLGSVKLARAGAGGWW